MNKTKKKIIYFFLGFSLTSILVVFAFSKTNTNDPNSINPKNTIQVSEVYIPEKVTIFDEEVPLEYFDVIESLERELIINVYFQSQTIQFIKYAHRFFPIIDSILLKENIPLDFKYVALAESGLRVNISPKGAAGFWQILESTAKENKLEVNEQVDQRYDLIKSTEAACRYFKQAYKKFGNWTLAAASYNIGINGLLKQTNFQNIDNYYNLYTNSETSRYIFRIIALKLIMENPENYGYNELEKYPSIPYSTIVVDSSISNLAKFADSLGSNYKLLKMMNPWLRDKYLPNDSKKKYSIILISNSNRKIN